MGGVFIGWGVFNFVEGIIDHHILEVHHVVERLGLSIYDYFFLALGVIFMVLGAVFTHEAGIDENVWKMTKTKTKLILQKRHTGAKDQD
jgi:uncharacterized membrane protein